MRTSPRRILSGTSCSPRMYLLSKSVMKTTLITRAIGIGVVFCYSALHSTITTTTGTARFSASAMSMNNIMPRKDIRIFCYGDSLTAGSFPPDDELHPYGPHLERTLTESLVQKCGSQTQQSQPCNIEVSSDSSGDRTDPPKVAVRWIGLPGWTARGMMQYADDPEIGLRPAIRKVQNPSLSLVIILAGTNDLAMEAGSTDGKGSERIANDVIGLHKIAHASGIPTLAVSIPPSGWQATSANAHALATDTNAKIEAWCDSTERAHFVKHPIESWSRDDARWAYDGLHFSAKGYQEIGESLAPVVYQILLPNTNRNQ